VKCRGDKMRGGWVQFANRLPRSVVSAVVVSGFVVGAGCGGHGQSATTVTVYRARAAAMCRAESKALDALGQPTTKAGLRRYLTKALALAQGRVQNLERLIPPPSFRTRHQRLIDGTKTGVGLLAAAVTKMNRGADPSTVVPGLRGLSRLDKTEVAIWNSLGVKKCANE
jgi:hypothetical protein